MSGKGEKARNGTEEGVGKQQSEYELRPSVRQREYSDKEGYTGEEDASTI